MPRPNRPSWHAHSGRFRSRINGKVEYFPKSIGRYDKPLIDGIPSAAWKHLAKLLESPPPTTRGTEPTVDYLLAWYQQWLEEEHKAKRLESKAHVNFALATTLDLDADILCGVCRNAFHAAQPNEKLARLIERIKEGK